MPAVLSVAFFLSGLTALILEVVWGRLLQYVFGASALALSSVLTAYMAGLALGSFLAGRIADRLRRPAVAYALCEIGVGACALIIPLVIGLYPGVYRVLWASYRPSFYLFSLLRFLLVFATLIVPTTLMGATLPLLARTVSGGAPASTRAVARSVGFLYTANLWGACGGTALAGLVLLPRFGISRASHLAAGLDLALGVCVAAWAWLLLRARAAPAGAPDEDDPEPDPAAEENEELRAVLAGEAEDAASMRAAAAPLGRGARLVVLAAFAIGGGTAMIDQVLWTRVLCLSIGSSTYAFTLILLCFLVGLGAGGLWGARRAGKLRRPGRALAAAHAVVAAAGLGTVLVADRLPRVFLWLVAGSDAAAESVMLVMFLTVAAAILVPTIAMGTIFPLTIRLVAGRAGVGRTVGSAYAWNTVGAIVGSFASGFVVIPTLGLERGLIGAAVVSAGLGAAVLAATEDAAPRRTRPLLVAVALPAVALLVALALPRWDPGRLSEGLFRIPIAGDLYGTPYEPPDEILSYAEGITTTVTVERNRDNVSLKVNGKVDASNRGDMPSQIFAGALPLVFHPDLGRRPLDMLLVGYGSGVSAGAALQFPLARLDLVEIEREVVNASRFFTAVNHDPLSDPRLHLEVNDGRNYLFATTETYDVIVSEPSNPWIAGVSSLFTAEYFDLVRSHLRPGGILLQWLQLYEIKPERVKAVMRTLLDRFPYAQIFTSESGSTDLFMLASEHPIPLDLRTVTHALADPRVAAELGRANVVTPHDLIARHVMSRAVAATWYAGATVNTDDNLYLEFSAPRDLFTARVHHGATSFLYDEHRLGDIAAELEGYGATDAELAANYGALALSLLRHGRERECLELVAMSEKVGGSPAARHAALLHALLEGDEAHPLPLDRAILSPKPPATAPADAPGLYKNGDVYDLLRSLMRAANWDEAVRLMEVMEAWFTDGPLYDLILGYLEMTRMRWTHAITALTRAVEASAPPGGPVEVHVAALYYLARTYWYYLEPPEAFKAIDAYVDQMEAAGLDLPIRLPPMP